MIRKETCVKIWSCHSEIEKAEKLILDMKESLSKTGEVDLINKWGDRKGLTLGVPSDHSGSRTLYNVPVDLAIKVIDAHVEAQKQLLVRYNAEALIEAK